MIERKLILGMPVLLILGIIAQAIMLVLVVVLFVPMLIWPAMLNRPYKWITRGTARVIAKGMVGRKRQKIAA